MLVVVVVYFNLLSTLPEIRKLSQEKDPERQDGHIVRIINIFQTAVCYSFF